MIQVSRLGEVSKRFERRELGTRARARDLADRRRQSLVGSEAMDYPGGVRDDRSPETFSSELGGLNEGRRPPSFNDEFRGLSDSELRRSDRPEGPRESGRLGTWIAVGLGSTLAIAGIAAGAYFGLAALEQRREASAAVEPAPSEPAPSEPTPGPAPSEPTPSDPWAETPPIQPSGDPLPWPPPSWERPEPTPNQNPTPTPEPTTPTPAPTPTPEPTPSDALATYLDGSTRGRISGLAPRLTALDRAVQTCWTSAVERGERGKHTLALAFTIRWNRKAVGVVASGEGTSATLRECVEQAVPRSGWPEPSDLGDAHVVRRWTLEG